MLISLIAEGFSTVFSWPRDRARTQSGAEDDIIRQNRALLQDLDFRASECLAGDLAMLALMARSHG